MIGDPILTSDRITAAVGHLGLLVLSSFGFIVPLLLRDRQREPGGWLDFQLLQAVAWNVLQPVYFLLVILLEGIGLVVALLLLSARPGGLTVPQIGWAVAVFAAIFALAGLLYALAAVCGVLACLLGRNFHYPWLGGRLQRYLTAEGETETRIARLLAAMAHAAILIPLTGMLLPLWNLLQRAGRSAWSRFQALQTLLYQGIGLAVGLLLIATAWLAALPVIIFAGEITTAYKLGTLSFQQFLVFVPLFLYLLLAGAALLLAPLYQTLGLVAAVRVLRGKEYRYPLIGCWLAR
ncbi:MAG: DUF4870 domain-containing protein [Anaerolineae bacterium]|nr:DUF4870 domain-containing protein [Anaerolineae bacterium]